MSGEPKPPGAPSAEEQVQLEAFFEEARQTHAERIAACRAVLEHDKLYKKPRLTREMYQTGLALINAANDPGLRSK